MSAKTFLMVGGAIAVGYGVAFLMAPGTVTAMYGGGSTAAVLLGYRYFGVALLAVGLMCWTLRECRDPALLQGVLVANAIANVAGIAVSLWGTLSGTINALGWLNVALYCGLAAWCVALLAARGRGAAAATA